LALDGESYPHPDLAKQRIQHQASILEDIDPIKIGGFLEFFNATGLVLSNDQ